MKNATNPLEQNVPLKPLSKAEIQKLVISAQKGDEEAFNELYDQYYPIIHRRVWHLVPASEVDDVTQEVFFSAIRSLKNFRGESQFSTWLYTLTSRQVANYYRKQERTPQQTDKDFEEYADSFPGSFGVSDGHVDEFILIRNGLVTLPKEYQWVIFLRLIEGYKFREIAEILEKSLDASKSLFRRAIQTLQQKVETK